MDELSTVLTLFDQGNLGQAEEILNDMLQKNPYNPAALHHMGLLHYQRGEYGLAEQYIRKSLAQEPDNPGAHYDLGNSLMEMDRPDDAIESFQQAIGIDASYADAYSNLGLVYHEKGLRDEAISFYRKALDINPDLPYTNNNLGLALAEKGEVDEAIQYFDKALASHPNYADACYNLGNAYTSKKQHEKALPLYERAAALSPDTPELFEAMGDCCKELDRLKEAVLCFQKALKSLPDHLPLLLKLAHIIDYMGNSGEARNFYEKILSLAPYMTSVRLAKCIALLPTIFTDAAHIDKSRKEYGEELTALVATTPLDTPELIKEAVKAVGYRQPYQLPYQGFNDRELQKIYGGFLCRIMAAGYPQYAIPPAVPVLSPGDPIRVGFVSAYFYRHSNWKIPVKGWVENLDRQKFSLYGYHIGEVKDQETASARECFPRFVEDVRSFQELCETIRNDRLHVLIYPETGMDPVSVQLASLRLAPVQCVSWGHPETSGLPTIDYFLSSELMEPAHVGECYTEKLVRLPNLSVHYTPLEVTPVHMTRETFGLRQDSVLYFCSQHLSKYHPRDDEVFPRIAREAGDCQFLFIAARSEWVTEEFRKRITGAFQRFDLSPEQYITILPSLSQSQYHTLNLLADVFLDSIGWSGCNSTFEALACDQPVVTIPGEFMRGCHSSAILTMMGMEETIAKTVDEYIAIAVKLGTDEDYRDEISEKIAERKHRAYGDMAPVKALEEFLERVVREGGL